MVYETVGFFVTFSSARSQPKTAEKIAILFLKWKIFISNSSILTVSTQ